LDDDDDTAGRLKLLVSLQLAETLVDECLSRGSKDNMSVVIVAFEAAPRPSQEKIEEYKKLKEEEAKRQAQEEAGENNFGNESNPSNTGQQPGGLGFQ
jgi:ribosomal protein L12E/L44/L45/RPP1/RPP2